MPITLNGTTGITTPADTVTTITSPAATALIIQSAGTTAMTIDTSQNVGIGTTSTLSAKFTINAGTTGGQIIYGSTSPYISLSDAYNNTPAYLRYVVSSTEMQFICAGGANTGYMTFATGNGNERMRIDSSGNLLVGTTSADARITVKGADSTSSNFSIYARNSSNTALMTVRNDGAGYLLASAWNYGSDRLLKENIYYLTPAECLEKILQAKPVKYDFIIGAKDNYGYIAQDVQEWLPEAVSETENGTLGLKSDFIDAMGTGAIQAIHMMIKELSAKNDALEARLAALEAK